MTEPAPSSFISLRPALCAALAGLVLCAACSGDTQASGQDDAEREDVTPLVRVAVLTKREVQREIETTAYLESEHRVPVYPRVGGRVDSVPVDEGDIVKKGDLLAEIDDREARSATRPARGQPGDSQDR